jgi:hypothetical protein
MSDTKRGGKDHSYEYWSARPFNKAGGMVGKFTKKRTHKAERAQGKLEAKEKEEK